MEVSLLWKFGRDFLLSLWIFFSPLLSRATPSLSEPTQDRRNQSRSDAELSPEMAIECAEVLWGRMLEMGLTSKERERLIDPVIRILKSHDSHYSFREDITHELYRDPKVEQAYNIRLVNKELSKKILGTSEKESVLSSNTFESIAVVSVDFDHFKRVNETYGHSEADKVLVEFGEWVSDEICSTGTGSQYMICSSDTWFVRNGGEEFYFYIRNASEDRVRHFAQQLVKAFKERGFLKGRQKIKDETHPFYFGGDDFTISAGYFFLPLRTQNQRAKLSPSQTEILDQLEWDLSSSQSVRPTKDQVESLLSLIKRAADEARGAAKEAGRNRARGFQGSLQ
jgi:diguanylate cyclase (GGDEF)-like protein